MKEKSNYAELLKDPRWIARSKEIRKWDRDCCCLCGASGSDARLQVHHMYYDMNKNPWEYGSNALITVCDKCHKQLHADEKDFHKKLNGLLCKLGELGYTKTMILEILELLVDLTRDKNHLRDLYEFLRLGIPLQELLLLHNRAHKNNMFEKYEQDERQRMNHARKAHEWCSRNDDFSEDDYYAGYYDDEIQEYNNYIS